MAKKENSKDIFGAEHISLFDIDCEVKLAYVFWCV